MRASFISIAAGLALLASAGASAQGYVGGGIGYSRFDVDCTDIPSCDKSSVGGKLYGGWNFAKDWAAELSYFDWGKATGRESLDLVGRVRELPLATASGTLSMKLRGTGFGLGIAYFFAPAGSDWSGVLRAGVAQNKGKLTATADYGDGSSDSMTESKRSTQPYLGFGFGFKLSPTLTLTGEADFSRIKYRFDGLEDRADTQMFSIGVRYAF